MAGVFCSRSIHDGRCCCIHKVPAGLTCPACTQPGYALLAQPAPQQQPNQPLALSSPNPIFSRGYELVGIAVTGDEQNVLPAITWTFADMTGQQVLSHQCRACGAVDALPSVVLVFGEEIADRLSDSLQTAVHRSLEAVMEARAAVAARTEQAGPLVDGGPVIEMVEPPTEPTPE